MVAVSPSRIGFGFATQLEFNYQQLIGGAGLGSEHVEKLEFRRIRTVLSSSFLDGRIRSQFQLNLTPQALELIDLWVSFTRFRYATIRIGQFKVPFTRYRAQSFAALSFADWAPVTRMFGAERELGAEMLATGKRIGVEYAVGIFTGVNARASHAVQLQEVYGLIPENPSELGDGSVISEFHPALIARGAKNFGKIDTATNSDVLGGPLRHSIGGSIAWDPRPDVTINYPFRFSVEWLGKVQHLDINVVTYVGLFEKWTNEDFAFGSFGLLTELGYRFTATWELATRYSLTYLSEQLRDDAAAFAEFQIANATDPMEAMMQYAGVGELKWQAQLAAAASAHIIGNSLKVTLDLAWNPQKVVQGLQNRVELILQLQFVF